MIPKSGVISEIWHAQKWHRDLDRRVLSPMYDSGQDRHYFVDEPAYVCTGQMVIPVRWLEDEEGEVWVEVWEVKTDAATVKFTLADLRLLLMGNFQNLSTIVDSEVKLIKADNLEKNMLDLQDEGLIPKWSAETIEKMYPLRMPNPDRELAGGDPMYSSFIDIFGDDVSGNRSKSWNKHWNIYVNHRNLPRQLLHQQYHTHFISTSTCATVPKQFHGLKPIIE